MTYEGSDTREARMERERVAHGELPDRYAEPWGRPFFAAASPALRRGATILDVGAGRTPTLPLEVRPEGSRYVGLDLSERELCAAGPIAYDEAVVGDITKRLGAFEDRFDLILSWQVLEHVDSMAAALENMRAYLRPGGRMVAQISGRFAIFALFGRLIPYPVSRPLMNRVLRMDPDTKFPTHYDACYATALERLLDPWKKIEIQPRYKGGAYFRFWRPLERSYLSFENWVARSDRRNLATHYVICAVK